MGSYDWPGNIRELQNITERAVLLADGECIAAAHLPREIVGHLEAAHQPRRAAGNTPRE